MFLKPFGFITSRCNFLQRRRGGGVQQAWRSHAHLRRQSLASRWLFKEGSDDSTKNYLLSLGNVYVKCVNVSTAVAAVNALHGRWFAGFPPSWSILSHFTSLNMDHESQSVFFQARWLQQPTCLWSTITICSQVRSFFEDQNYLKRLTLTSWTSKLNHFSCRLCEPFCQSALASMNFLPFSLERVVVDEFKSRIFSPHPDVDMFLPQMMEFGRNLSRCVLKPMRLV